jgi:hypothetical protein
MKKNAGANAHYMLKILSFFSFLHFILFCLFFLWVSGGGADSNGDTHVNDMSS